MVGVRAPRQFSVTFFARLNGTTTVTPFFGSILMEANVHGHDTTMAMYKWVSEGVEPAKTRYTGGVLITRENFEQVLKDHGMWPK